MIHLAHLPEQIEKPNMCYIEVEGLRSARLSYNQCFDMRAGMNVDGLLDEVMLSK